MRLQYHKWDTSTPGMIGEKLANLQNNEIHVHPPLSRSQFNNILEQTHARFPAVVQSELKLAISLNYLLSGRILTFPSH